MIILLVLWRGGETVSPHLIRFFESGLWSMICSVGVSVGIQSAFVSMHPFLATYVRRMGASRSRVVHRIRGGVVDLLSIWGRCLIV